eukprot:gene15001-16550_t
MNRKARMKIDTPVGETEQIEIEDVVKQGTIFGPLLCCSNTSKIDEIGTVSAETMISPNMPIGTLIYVDDIGMAGSKTTIETVGKNLRIMESVKKFTFNTDKSKYMVIKGRKEKIEEPEIKVKKGDIQRTEKYKYLGNWIDEKGSLEVQIEELERKSYSVIAEIMKIGKEELLGKLSTEAGLIMYEKTVVPMITYNLECWTNIEGKHLKRLEQIQGGILKRILKLPSSTPYWALLKELGIWTLKRKVDYQRLMLFQNLMKSDESRLGRQIVEEQMKCRGRNWFNYTKQIAEEIGIELERVFELSKEQWKREVKNKVQESLEKEAKEKELEFKKMRHQREQKFERKRYLKEMGIKEASDVERLSSLLL